MSDEPLRPTLEVDIACVGFGPAMAGFLTTLSKAWGPAAPTPPESRIMPGLPPQVVCYERADDPGFGVSGVVTRGRALTASLGPDGPPPAEVPSWAPVRDEKLVYLLDPHRASRRPFSFRCADALLKPLVGSRRAWEFPWIPPFLHKKPGWVFSLGQFCSWASSQVMASGVAQIWPSSPAGAAVVENNAVCGIRLLDQGLDRHGRPEAGWTPGMEIRAALTVVGDGPVGALGRQLDKAFGKGPPPSGREWALGMKFVVELPAHCPWPEGTVIHTFGYPEPEIFGFAYVFPGRLAALGIFIPSWWQNPTRHAYRYLQHFIMHPYFWPHLRGGTLRSWGAKSIEESGLEAEPALAGDGYARIGEGSGSTNILTNSGVDEAWATGTMLAEAVLELWKEGAPFTGQNLERTYVARRRASWVQAEARQARRARRGFARGVLPGLLGMGLAGLTGGRLAWPGKKAPSAPGLPSLESYLHGRLTEAETKALRADCQARGLPLHDAVMDRLGWPAIPHDGQLLISQQDALLLGGKVQAPPGAADHVIFQGGSVCLTCREQVCVEACSGNAIAVNPAGGTPLFEREKCVHCGACLWNCSHFETLPEGGVAFHAGPGGLHSADN